MFAKLNDLEKSHKKFTYRGRYGGLSPLRRVERNKVYSKGGDFPTWNRDRSVFLYRKVTSFFHQSYQSLLQVVLHTYQR
jgi:hypothetical protein